MLNVNDVREASINVVGDFRIPVLNERSISIKEIREVVNKMKAGRKRKQ